MNVYLKYQHPGVQFAVLLGLTVAMFLISGVITASFFGDVALSLTSSQEVISDEALRQFKWAQLISAIITFIIPSLVYSYLSDERPIQYVGIKNRLLPFVVFIVILLLVSIQPFALYLGQLNQQWDFGPMQEEIKKTEAMYERLMNNFTRMRTAGDLAVNLLIIGLVPAIGEELFFRGALQNVLERWIKRPWVAIFLSSGMFALLHGTAFKLMPIFVLGFALGTLFYITRNLWYNILFHFLNNSLALIVTFYASGNPALKKFSEDDVHISGMVAIGSLIITIGLFYLVRKRIPYTSLPSANEPDRYKI